MNADLFHSHLRRVCLGSTPDPALRTEVARRLSANLLKPRDLQLLLFSVKGVEWNTVRQATLQAVVRQTEFAPAIFNILQQKGELAARPDVKIQPIGKSGAGWFLALARCTVAGRVIESSIQKHTVLKRAEQLALTSLLAELTGFDDPLAVSGTSTAKQQSGAPSFASPTFPAPRPGNRPLTGAHLYTSATELRDLLSQPGALDQPGDLFPAVAERLLYGQLDPADMYYVLFGTSADTWAQARASALVNLAAFPGGPSWALQLYCAAHKASEERFSDPVQVEGAPAGFKTSAELDLANGQTVVGDWFTGTTKATAKAGARIMLLARLADVPAPQTLLMRPSRSAILTFIEPERSSLYRALGKKQRAVGAVTEFDQRKMITGLSFTPAEWTGDQFEVTVSCDHLGRALSVTGGGSSKPTAKEAAANILIRLINRLIERGDSGELAGHPASTATDDPGTVEDPGPAVDDVGTPPARIPTARTPSQPAAPAPTDIPNARRRQPPTTITAHEDIVQMLKRGCALAFEAGSPSEAVFLMSGPGLGGVDPDDGELEYRYLRPAGDTRSAGVRTACRLIDPATLAHPLANAADSDLHPSARAWKTAMVLGLEMIAAGQLVPAIAGDGMPTWRLCPADEHQTRRRRQIAAQLAPLPVSVAARPHPKQPAEPDSVLHDFLDALADRFTPSPGARHLFGDAPFTGPAARTAAHLRGWTDLVERHADPCEPPGMILRIAPPGDGSAPTLRALLLLHEPGGDSTSAVEAAQVWSGGASLPGDVPDLARRSARLLRQAAAIYLPLRDLGARDRPEALLLSMEDAAGLPGAVCEELGEAGITVEWAEEWTCPVQLTAVADHGADVADSGFSLDGLVEFRWQLCVNGRVLTEEEMDLLAEAHRPLIRLHDQWLLIEETVRQKMRHRLIGTHSVREKLLDVVAGIITIDGRTFACSPAAGLAEMINALRTGERGTELTAVPTGLARELYEYQHRGFDWTARLAGRGFGACLADDMGTGKTLTAITLALHLPTDERSIRALVVVPASLLVNWRREFEKYAPGLPVVLYHGPSRSLTGVTEDHVVLTSYATMARDAELLGEYHWELIVADEAQMLKNPGTIIARAARTLSATTRLALTGTPLENNLDELWAILTWSNPGLFGTMAAFRRRFARPIDAAETPEQRDQAVARLRAFIRPFFLRRLKTDPAVGLNLPPKTERRRLMYMSEEQIGLYEAACRQVREIVGTTGDRRRGLTMNLAHALRRICDSPAVYLGESIESMAADPDRSEARAPKLEAVREIAEDATARNGAVLVYTGYVEAGVLLHAHLVARGFANARYFNGTTPRTRRDEIVDEFQAGDVPVLIMTRGVGAAGLNLTYATDVVHFDQGWNPGLESQANDRAHRIGQKYEVTIHTLQSEGTIEEKINRLLKHKRHLADTVLPTGEIDLSQLDDTELIALITMETRR